MVFWVIHSVAWSTRLTNTLLQRHVVVYTCERVNALSTDEPLFSVPCRLAIHPQKVHIIFYFFGCDE